MSNFLSFFKSFTNLAWAAVVVFLVIMWKGSCNGKQQLADNNAAAHDTIKLQESRITQLRNDSMAVVSHLRDSAAVLHTRDSGLWVQKSRDAQAWENRSQTLADYIASHKPQKADTTGFMFVPSEYVDSCTACAMSLKTAIKGIDSARDLANKTADLITYELLIREKALAIQTHYSDSLYSLSGAKDRLIDKMAKDFKPRNQVYLGPEMIGGPKTLFTNIGGVVSLKTKRDKLFQFSGGIQSIGGWYARINANFKIQLHR